MTVAFDTAGPSSAGTGVLSTGATTTLSWTHTTGAGANAILVGVNQDDGSNHTMTATCNGTAMTSLGLIDTTGGTTVSNFTGYLQLFLATTSVLASAGNAIVVTCSAAVPSGSDMNGGSLSFSGYTGHGTPVTAFTATPGMTVTIASSTSGYLIAGFFCSSAAITQAGGTATGRFLENFEGGASFNNTGNTAAATAPATGGSVTITWTSSGATAYCSIGVELQGSLGTDTTPAYAGAASDLGGGTGSWTSPGNADGAADSTYATWTAP